MPPRHNSSTELVSFHTPEIPPELHEGYLRASKAELPSVLSKGLDSSHEFVRFKDFDSDSIRIALDDQALIARAHDTEYPCAATAFQKGYIFATWDRESTSDQPFKFFTFPGMVATQVHAFEQKARELNPTLSNEWLQVQKAKVAQTATTVSENLVQEAISDRLFTRVQYMVSPYVNKHTFETFAEIVPHYNPLSHLFAVKLANEIFKESQRVSGARGITDLQQRRLKTMFDAVAADNPAVGAYKYQIVHDAFREATERPASLRSRLLRSSTGVLSQEAQRQLEERYDGYEKYLPESAHGIDARAFLPRPTLGQDALSAALTEAAAVRSKLGEIEPAKVARHAAISASLAGALGGLIANPATAAPERASTAITLQTTASKPMVELNAENVVAYSAMPSLVETSVRSGEKCATPFVYTDNMKKAVDNLIARGGKWKNQGIVLDFYLEKCVGLKASAGIVGNTQAESGTNPTRHQVHGSAYGVFQHDNGRRDKLMALPGYNKLSTQLKFAWGEMVRGSMVDNLQRATSPEQGAVVFEELFERAGVPRMGVRKSEARKIYNEFLKEYKIVEANAEHVTTHTATPPRASTPVVSATQKLEFADSVAEDKTELKLQPVSFVTLPDSVGRDTAAASRNTVRARFEALLGSPDASSSPESPALPDAADGHLPSHLARVALSDQLAAAVVGQTPAQTHAAFAGSSTATPDSPSTPTSAAESAAPAHPLDMAMGTLSTPATTAPQSPATPDASSAPTTPDVSAGNSTTAASPSIFDLLGSSSADKSQAASAIPSLLPTSDVQTQPTTTSLAEATNATPTTETDSAQPNTLSPETVSQANNTESTLNATVTDTPSNSNKPDEKAAPVEKNADAPKVQPETAKPQSTIEQRRQAEIERLKKSGDFKKSQALDDAQRSPLEKKLESDGQKNGRLKDVERLGSRWGDASLYAPAAEQFRKLDAAYYKEFGKHIVINDSYRSYARQVATKADAVSKGRPQFAATPGHSKHGWGLALDLGGGMQSFNSKEYKWMLKHALDFGFNHPDFADDSSSPEPWHWEYVLSE